MSSRNTLIAVAVKHNGNWDSILTDLELKNYPEGEELESLLKTINCEVLTILDNEYPPYLKEVYMPPFVLFYRGDISLLNNPIKNIAVVGTRKPTDYAVKATKEIVKGIAKDYYVVSGMANGIDAIAHNEAMNSGGRTIAVLGHGFNYCYPSENSRIYRKMQKHHLVITEYPPTCPPSQDNFPVRNRIIAQISKAVLITEGGKRSGTFITANFAVHYNREVMCVPSSNLNESLCNLLIREGAILIENSDQVKEIMERFSYYGK